MNHKYNSATTPATIEPPARVDAHMRTFENAHAAIGFGSGIVGVTVLVAAGLVVWQQRHWPPIALVVFSGIWLAIGGALVFYGVLATWRNTIDERRDSAEYTNAVAQHEHVIAQREELAKRLIAAEKQLAMLSATKPIAIHSGGTTRTADASQSAARKRARAWVMGNMFDTAGQLVNVYTESLKIRGPYPFSKTKRRGDAVLTDAHNLLTAIGYVVERDGNYFWNDHAPKTIGEIDEDDLL